MEVLKCSVCRSARNPLGTLTLPGGQPYSVLVCILCVEAAYPLPPVGARWVSMPEYG